MRTAWFLACLTFFSLTAFGQTSPPRFEELARQFDYDRATPLDVREAGRQKREGVTVIDLSYASPRGGRVPAYFVVPSGRGPFATTSTCSPSLKKSPSTTPGTRSTRRRDSNATAGWPKDFSSAR
jgi:hypothetical protein